jgi:uncharacterized protein
MHSDWFIGRHVIPKYQGYMESQVGRMLGIKGPGGHGRRGGGMRQEVVEEYGYDTKYAMHAARLGLQCIELLQNGKLELPIQGWQREWLLDLRLGKVPFDEFFAVVLELDAELTIMRGDESIRPHCEVDKIVQWSIDAHHEMWYETWRTD